LAVVDSQLTIVVIALIQYTSVNAIWFPITNILVCSIEYKKTLSIATKVSTVVSDENENGGGGGSGNDNDNGQQCTEAVIEADVGQ
jgi:hypothetical protein